jgi:hypothetical protein
MRMTTKLLALAAAGTLSTGLARAETLRFHASLDGKSATSTTGSAATGTAKVRVDTVTHRVSVDLAVHGLTVDALWDKLVKGPIGPIHFHEYIARPGQPDDVVLVLPLPYGASYQPTRDGFRVRIKDYDYAAGARLLGSGATFEHFIAAMGSGHVVLNIHTDRFTNGEISGTVAAG